MSVHRKKIDRKARFHWKGNWSLWTRSQTLAALVCKWRWQIL